MRSRFRTKGPRILTALVLLAAGTGLSTSSLTSWRDGPVQVLMTAEQYREFGALPTEAARRSFIEQFWSEIDGRGGEGERSFRERFERRCETANARFAAGGLEGWRTDRGRVLIALGEPSSVHREPGDAISIEREVWTYGPSGSESAAALRVVFYRCADGRYKVSPSCALDRDPTSVAYDDEREEFIRKLREANPTADDSHFMRIIADLLLPIPGVVPLGRHGGGDEPVWRMEPPPRSAGAESPRGTYRSATSSFFFKAVDGSVLTALMIELPAPREGEAGAAPSDPSTYLGTVTIVETGGRGEDAPAAAPRTVSLDVVGGTNDPGRTALLGTVYLRGGRNYALRYAVKDGAHDQIFVRTAVLAVPEIGGGFSASSIVPAQAFGPATPGSGRFHVGSEEVVPKPGGAFRRSELLRLYLQVYDAAIDPKTSQARVDVSFRFYRMGSGFAKRYGKPFSVRGATGASMGLALPMGDWPPGPYRVEVELHDRVVDRRTVAEGRFSIVAE